MVKNLNISLDDGDYEELKRIKGNRSWRTLLKLGAREWEKSERS